MQDQKSSDKLSLPSNNIDKTNHLDVIMSDLSRDLQKMVSVMKTEIASLKHSCSFLGYYECEFFAIRIDQLRTRICAKFLPKFPNQAIDLLKSLLDLRPQISEEGNKGNRAVCDIFLRVCANLGKAFEAFTTPLDEIIELVFNLFITSDFKTSDIIFRFKNVLGNEGLKSIEQKLKQSRNSLNDPYGVKALTIKSRLKQIADWQNDVFAYISACSFNSQPSTREHLEIVKRFVKHCKGRKAIEWLDSMDISTSKLSSNKRKKLKVQALELCGYFEEAQAERLQWFEETLSTKVYKEIVMNSEVDFILSFIKVAIKRALDFPDPHVAIKFLIYIQEFEYLAQLVLLKNDILDGDKCYILRPAADILLELNPLAATLLHRKMIEPILANSHYRGYYLAAKDLVTCGILSTKITDWRQYEHHDSYFSELTRKYYRKQGFWLDHYSAAYGEKEKWSENRKSSSLTVSGQL